MLLAGNSIHKKWVLIKVRNRTLLNTLDVTNAKLKSDVSLRELHRLSQENLSLNTCGESKTEFTWFGYNVYLNDTETDDFVSDLSRQSIGSGITSFINKLPAPLRAVAGVVSLILSIQAEWISSRNNGCGVIMYFLDMNVIPHWIDPQ